MKNLKFLFAFVLLLNLGCEKTNQLDPNAPNDVPIQSMMPSIMLSLADIYSGQLNHYTVMLIQQVEGVGRCGILNNYIGMTPNRMDAIWRNFYNQVLNEIKIAKEKSEVLDFSHHQGVLLTLEAFTLLTMTDVFDDIPYSNGIAGLDNFNPSYDSQDQIFQFIFDHLDAAEELLKSSNTIVSIGKEDLFFEGNISSWKKVVHAIRARAELRIGNYDAALTSAMKSMNTAEDNLNFKFDGDLESEAWFYRFNRDRTGDLEFHPTLRNMLQLSNDLERLAIWDHPFRIDHPYFVADQEVELISYREMEFIKAECLLRLNGSESELKRAYHNGIKASFANLGLTEEQAQIFIDQAIITPNSGLTLEHIMSQKHVALFSQPEVYADFRRTDIPKLTPTSGVAVPVRLPYPESEHKFNENAPNYPDIFSDKVGWDD